MTINDLTELELIARIRRRLLPPPAWLVVGIGDDAAVVEPERNRLEAVTVDALVEGVHFDRRFTPPEAIGHRALAVNLSDLAAMGASPRLALLSLALPPNWPLADFDAAIGGLSDLAARQRLHVAGGNLTRSPGPLMVDVTVAGSIKRRGILRRTGARPGDELYVSGAIGGAAAGLQMLQAGRRLDPAASCAPVSDADEACIRRYLYPEPRVRLGSGLANNRAATACMDLSDGLSDAVRQIAEASGVGAVVSASALPIHPAARRWFESLGDDPVRAAISAGDDYELLFAVRPRWRGRVVAARRHGGVPLTRIGVCTEDLDVVLARADASEPTPLPRGFSHFR